MDLEDYEADSKGSSKLLLQQSNIMSDMSCEIDVRASQFNKIETELQNELAKLRNVEASNGQLKLEIDSLKSQLAKSAHKERLLTACLETTLKTMTTGEQTEQFFQQIKPIAEEQDISKVKRQVQNFLSSSEGQKENHVQKFFDQFNEQIVQLANKRKQEEKDSFILKTTITLERDIVLSTDQVINCLQSFKENIKNQIDSYFQSLKVSQKIFDSLKVNLEQFKQKEFQDKIDEIQGKFQKIEDDFIQESIKICENLMNKDNQVILLFQDPTTLCLEKQYVNSVLEFVQLQTKFTEQFKNNNFCLKKMYKDLYKIINELVAQ